MLHAILYTIIVCAVRAARAVTGGRWIPYTAAQVAARRASWLVCWAVPLLLAGPAAPPAFMAPPPLAWPPPAWGPPLPGGGMAWPPEFLPAGSAVIAGPPGAVGTPEPESLAILAAALAGLALLRWLRLAAPQHGEPRDNLRIR